MHRVNRELIFTLGYSAERGLVFAVAEPDHDRKQVSIVNLWLT